MADKQRKLGTRRASPSASPLLPPAPTQSRNREAAPGPYSNKETTRTPSHGRLNTTQVQAPPDLSNPHELARIAVPVAGAKMEAVRRFLFRLFLVYLAYTLLWVCPSLQSRSSNAICDGAGRLKDWLTPYSDTVVHKADETYRAYAEPYVKQYGHPLYQQGHKYYMEKAHPVVASATEKVKTSYHQHAHPHVQNAIHKTGTYIYSDKVQAHVNRAHEAAHACHKHVQDGIGRAKHLHSIHVQPVIDKVTPHVQAAWHHTSTSAMNAYDTSRGLYMKHVDPYAQRTFAVVADAVDKIKAWWAEIMYENFGEGRTARHTAERAIRAERRAQEAAKKAKAEADAQAESLKDKLLKKTQVVEQAVVDEAEYLKKLTGEKIHEAGKISENIKDAVVEKAHEAREAIARQADHLRHAGAHVVDSVTEETEHIAKLAKEKMGKMERLAKQEAAALKLAALKSGEGAKETAEKVTAKVRGAYDAAEQQAEDILTKVVETGKGAEKAADEKVKMIKKTVQENVESAEDTAKESFDNFRDSADQIVMSGKEQVDKAQGYAAQKIKNAGEQVEHVKDDMKHKAHDATAASKASLAAMLAGIEATFSRFYEYEDTETKALWSKLQSAIDNHVEAAKKSSQDLEKANREAYEEFQSYVKDWRKQGGDLEERLSKLSHTSVDSIKKIGLKAEEERVAAMSKAQTLSNNVEVYLSGMWEFLSDRLAASMATVASELDVFRGTSNEDDHKTVRDKLEELEKSARSKLESAGSEARTKAKQLMKQAEDIHADAGVKSREYVQRTRRLASEARDEIKGKIQSVQEGSEDCMHDPEDTKRLPEGGPAGLITDDAEPQVRIASEEPGSGHRHHRHY